MKKLGIAILILLLVAVALFLKDKYKFQHKEVYKSQIPSSELFEGPGYISLDKGIEVSVLADGLSAPTRLKITPNGGYLLVTQITGEVLSFRRNETGWDNSPSLVTMVETRFPGFPPDEGGLVGLTFSRDFSKNGKIFLLYTYKGKDGKTQNRISVSTLKENGGKLAGSRPKVIYQANIPGNPSHQITDAINVDVEGKPHLLFLMGEGFDAKKAQNPALEAGKLLLIQEDGKNPLGQRPYWENPKVQAIGIRNGYVLIKNPYDELGRIIITDTGPDHFDRLIYTNPFGEKPLNFAWEGVEEKLKDPIPDPNDPAVSDIVIQRLPETLTFVGADFTDSGKLIVTLFGKTGSKDNTPGKEIRIGSFTRFNDQPTVSFQTTVKRNPEANGKLGNPIGLAVDRKTGDFFFADIMEGRVYWAKTKGGDLN